MADPHNFFTQCVGRFVAGSITEKRTTDNKGRPIQPEKQKYEFGVAFPKTDADMQRIFGEIWQFMAGVWASDQGKLQALQSWFTTFEGLSMKISDGDKPNAKGNVNQNTVGHYVFWFSSTYQPKACNSTRQEIDPHTIKRGYYVRIAGNINDNTLALGDGAGMYLNCSHMMLEFEGDVITGGVDAETAFGGAAPAQMPAGARPLGAAAGMPPVPPSSAPVVSPTVTAGTSGMPQQVPSAPPTTAYPSNPPAAPGVPQPPQPPAAYPQIMTPQPAAPGVPQPPQPPAAPGVPQPPQPPAAPGVPQPPQPPAAPGVPGLPPGMPGQ